MQRATIGDGARRPSDMDYAEHEKTYQLFLAADMLAVRRRRS